MSNEEAIDRLLNILSTEREFEFETVLVYDDFRAIEKAIKSLKTQPCNISTCKLAKMYMKEGGLII